MNVAQAVERLTDVIRRKHLSLSTEHSYRAWLKRYCAHLNKLPPQLASEQKLERFLTTLAKDDVAASTQNQAFNAIIFFYKEVAKTELKNIQSLRARRPQQLRHAPTRDEALRLMKAVQTDAPVEVGLAVQLLYGCGLRVSEPLNLRIRDVNFETGQLTIRAAKGGKDRYVSIPHSLAAALNEQMERARALWKRDQTDKVPVALPHQLAVKYPQRQFEWDWAWVFPANGTSLHPRTKKLLRWRLHEVNLQRAIRKAGHKIRACVLPHELRHAYATHCLDRGANPRAIQEAMGHKSLETTMGYLHAETAGVRSPLDG
jgi:integron integrase